MEFALKSENYRALCQQ